MISIITPIYNAERYLERCLNSLLNQTYKNIELVLIDDGSKDGSGTICKRYIEKDSRVRYVYQENQGAGAARRRGVKEAKGEFIFFIDSDDYLENDALESLMSAFSDDVDCVVGQHERFGEMKEIKQVVFPTGIINFSKLPEVSIAKVALHSCYGQELWNKLYRTNIVKEAFQSRNITVPYGEDSLYLIELYIRMRAIKCISKLTYHYEFRPDSLARSTEKFLLLEDFANECLLLKGNLEQFNLQEVIPIVVLHVLNVALVKYRGEQGEKKLIADFCKLQDEPFFVDCAKTFLKNKDCFRKKYGLTKVQYYRGIGLYKAIVKRDLWYYIKWYPLKADESISIITFIKAYINKMLGRVNYEREKK